MTGVQTCALPISKRNAGKSRGQKIKEQLDGLTPEQALSRNPVWQAYLERREAYKAKLQAEGAEWRQAQGISYTEQQCMDCIEMTGKGYSLREAAEALGLYYSAVNMCIYRSDSLKAAMNAAREQYAHERVRRIDEIVASEPDPARARILVDAIKWEVSKVLPKFYGDKIDVGVSDKVSFSINLAPSSGK